MAENDKKNKLTRNVIVSIVAQIVSLVVGVILNLIVPKVLGVYDYAYWQSFVLYVGYVGILNFGLLDGIVLRYAQYDYDELDRPRLRAQFIVLFFICVWMMITVLFLAGKFAENENKFVWYFVAIGIVTKHLMAYTSYMLQITNRINRYAMVVIVQRVTYGIFVIILMFLKVKIFYWYCIAELIGELVGHAIGARYNKGLYFGKIISWKNMINEVWYSMTSGIKLLIANWSAMLLLGSARMVVQWHWGDLMFGKVSFAFSVSNLFLTFITAISVVLFPALKRMEPEQMPKLYKAIREIVSPLLFGVMILYFPGCVILQMWLPAYSLSLEYLGILLPMIVYSAKVSLLTNNYLKAYRKEKEMLWINVFSVIIAFGCFFISAYVVDNILVLLLCIVFTIMLRSIVSEIVVMRIIGIRFVADFIIEAVMTAIFILCAGIDDLVIGFTFYCGALVGYLFYYRKLLLEMISNINKRRKNRIHG